MKSNELLKIVTSTMPKVNEFDMIKRYGFTRWVSLWILKILVFCFITWFLIVVAHVKFSIGQ